MAWVYLDDGFPNHPKISAAGGDAGWLFVCGMAYIKRYGTKGTIPKTEVVKLSDRKSPSRLARRLVEVGLWIDGDGQYEVHDYDEWNRPQVSRSDAGRKAARARWDRDAKRNAIASPSHDPPHMRSDMRTDANAYASECPVPIPSDLQLTKTLPGWHADSGNGHNKFGERKPSGDGNSEQTRPPLSPVATAPEPERISSEKLREINAPAHAKLRADRGFNDLGNETK